MQQEEEKAETPSHEQNVFLIINRQMIPLEKKVTRLGRQLDNDVVFHEEAISRFHAEIRSACRQREPPVTAAVVSPLTFSSPAALST